MQSPSCSPQILQLMSRKVDREVINYLVHTTIETVDFALGRPTSHIFAAPSTIPRPFLQLTLEVIRKSRVEIPVILVALVYLERVRPQLRISDERWACERILIGALILAAKYVSDYTIKNARWARWSGTFSKEDIGRMERELLDILDWNLSIAEGDIMAHHEHLLLITPQPAPPVILKRPRSSFQTVSGLGLELSSFCPPIPRNDATAPANTTRALTSSVTLPGISSFLHQPHRHPSGSSQSSLQLPSILSVTSGEERPCKRPRLIENLFNTRQPLSMANKYRHSLATMPRRPANAQIFEPGELSFPWSKAFDPFIFSYIPPVSFYES